MTKLDLVFMFGIVVLMMTSLWLPFDETDDVKANERSGLTLYTDHGTGCQYVKGGIFGGTTPRLDDTGKHMCGASTEDQTDND